MVDVFESVDDSLKGRIVGIWINMSEQEKAHFINQVSLVLSVWGSDETGKMLVVRAIERLVSDKSSTLSDFGIYVESLLRTRNVPADRLPKIKRAAVIMDGYRVKHALPTEPRKDIGI